MGSAWGYHTPRMFRILSILLAAPILLATMPLPLAWSGDKKSAAGTGSSVESQPETGTVDVSAVKNKLVVLHDGKQHYVAVIPFGDLYDHFYYGDGKRFYAQLVSGGGSVGKESWNRVFWEPRVNAPWKGSIAFAKDQTTVQCGDRATEFKPLDAGEQAKVLGAASFFKTSWLHRAWLRSAAKVCQCDSIRRGSPRIAAP